MKKKILSLVAAAGLYLLAGAAFSQSLLELAIGMYRIEAEVANTPQLRERGLMYRTAMADNHGMLFIFSRQDRHCMWMANTLIPLSVAFLDAQGNILNIEEMQPQTRTSHCAAGPAVYALEMNTGWFQRRGISAGASLKGMDKLATVR